jgi:hypothetical protein
VNKSELKKLFLDELQKHLAPYNFRLVRAMDWFARKEGNITRIFQVSFHNSASGFGIVPGLGIRIHEVEKLYHDACGVEKTFRSHTLTINPALRDISKDVEYEYSLQSPQDIPPLTEKIVRVFRNTALPIFESSSSLEEIDKILNDEPDKETPYYGIYLRQYKGIIVAKLNNRKDYEYLTELYRNKLKEIAGDFYIEDYEKILALLEKSKND